MIKKIFSKKGQITLEFSILMLAVITGATLAGYHMLVSAKEVKQSSIDTINTSTNVTMNALSTVN